MGFSVRDIAICVDDGNIVEQRRTELGLIEEMKSFEFVFILHLMIRVSQMTNELSNALHQKDQNIVNAMGLIVTVKDRLQHLRDNGWNAFLKEVETFCGKKSILVSRMEDTMPIRGRSRREGKD
ncbi:hypothetical protein Sango_1550700 [Sesamum angolense]|uniref:Uncharacterized protein n=1 Tax=Sesamum angolense TaxID=2727404 RepID=A0AAE1WPP8_9LAMI|nr:hypothetical protein Sango_1550700 [Sesamum angolense]